MNIRIKILQLRLWLGWDQTSRDARARIALNAKLTDIRNKATAHEARTRSAVIDSGLGHQIGDEIVLNAEHFPTTGRIIDVAVLEGQETMNVPSRGKEPISEFTTHNVTDHNVSEDGLQMIEVDGDANAALAAWKLGETMEIIRDRMFDRTDSATDNPLQAIDWQLELPE